MFGLFKERDNKTGYNARMIATMIDWLLLGFLFMPIFSFISTLIYGPRTPSVFLSQMAQEVGPDVKTFEGYYNYLMQSGAFQKYMVDEHGIRKIIFEIIIQVSVIFLLYLLFWKKKQATPGKMIMKIKIVDFETGNPPTNTQLLLRVVGYVLSAIPLFLGYFWILFNKNHRAWHDYFSGTQVVRVDSKK